MRTNAPLPRPCRPAGAFPSVAALAAALALFAAGPGCRQEAAPAQGPSGPGVPRPAATTAPATGPAPVTDGGRPTAAGEPARPAQPATTPPATTPPAAGGAADAPTPPAGAAAPPSEPSATDEDPDLLAEAHLAAAAADRAEAAVAAGRLPDSLTAAREGLAALRMVSPEGETARARLAGVLAASGELEDARVTAGRALVKLDRMEIAAGHRLPPLRGAIVTAMAAADQEPLALKVAEPLSPTDAAAAWRAAAGLLRARGAAEAAARAEAHAEARAEARADAPAPPTAP